MRNLINTIAWNTGINKEYRFGELLGQGSFGEVFKARRKDTGHPKAIKKASENALMKKGSGYRQRIYEEVRIHQTLNHENIVKLEKWYRETNDGSSDDAIIYLVLEYCENGTLKAYVEKRKISCVKTCLPLAEISSYMSQLINGLKYLHNQRIVHRDLSNNNILLTESYTKIKICDFGLSKKLDANQHKTTTFVGTPNFISPEVGRGENYGFETDVYSLGCLFYFMLMGEVDSLHPKRDPNRIDRSVFRPPNKTTIEDALVKVEHLEIKSSVLNLLQQMLNIDPISRIKLEAAHRHSFLTEQTPRIRQYSCTYTHDSGIGGISTDRASVKTNSYQSSRNHREVTHCRRPPSVQPMRAHYAENYLRPPLSCREPYVAAASCSESGARAELCTGGGGGGSRGHDVHGHLTAAAHLSSNVSCCLHSRYDDNNICVACKRQRSLSRGGEPPFRNTCASASSTNNRLLPFDCRHSRLNDIGNCLRCNELFNVAPIDTCCNSKPSCSNSKPTSPPRPIISVDDCVKSQTINTELKKKRPEQLDSMGALPGRWKIGDCHIKIGNDRLVQVKLNDCLMQIKPDGSKIKISGKTGNNVYKFIDLPHTYFDMYDKAVECLSSSRISLADFGTFKLLMNGDFDGRLYSGRSVHIRGQDLTDAASLARVCENFTKTEAEVIRTVLRLFEIKLGGETNVDEFSSKKSAVKQRVPALQRRDTVNDDDCSDKENRPSRSRSKFDEKDKFERPLDVRLVKQQAEDLYLLSDPSCRVKLSSTDGEVLIRFFLGDKDIIFHLTRQRATDPLKYRYSGEEEYKTYQRDQPNPVDVQKKAGDIKFILRLIEKYRKQQNDKS